MPDTIKIKLDRYDELLTRVSKLPKDLQDECHMEIVDAVFRIVATQKRLAPKDNGGIAQNTGFKEERKTDKLSFNIFSNPEYAGYIEFGTRYRVHVAAGLEEIANQFRGKGITSTLKAKEAIYAWAKRKGIDKKAWYIIFLSIMQTGIRAHPYFFQPFFDERAKMIANIEKILESQQL